MRASYKRVGMSWRPAIRNDRGETVWVGSVSCKNRDHSTLSSGQSAVALAKLAIQAATEPEKVGAMLAAVPPTFGSHREVAGWKMGIEAAKWAQSVANEIREASEGERTGA